MSRVWDVRMGDLKSLEAGWLDGLGQSLDTAALQAADKVLDAVCPDETEYTPKVPGIFPMEDGGVVLEWTNFDRVLTLEIERGKDSGEIMYSMFYLCVKTNHAFEFDTPDFSEIVRKLEETAIFSGFIPLSDAEDTK